MVWVAHTRHNHLNKHPESSESEAELQHLYLVAASISIPLLIVLGLVFRVMWLDFPLIFLGLFLHTPVEHAGKALWGKVKKSPAGHETHT